jgi:hypothetical protein
VRIPEGEGRNAERVTEQDLPPRKKRRGQILAPSHIGGIGARAEKL